ncbi:hypothetical protein CUMW_253080 [Citrus unshiu]|uniref:Uncharacterized protein n=1 Tax=Citrus unshiu TaxID=55188 RepID=A0A2H5QQT4_CITUN|nr:hypothetical protein CUMW_253080 [Citrus unshiu]
MEIEVVVAGEKINVATVIPEQYTLNKLWQDVRDICFDKPIRHANEVKVDVMLPWETTNMHMKTDSDLQDAFKKLKKITPVLFEKNDNEETPPDQFSVSQDTELDWFDLAGVDEFALSNLNAEVTASAGFSNSTVVVLESDKDNGNTAGESISAVLDFTMQLLETGVENDLVLSLVVFSLQYLLVNHEYWKYKVKHVRWKITLKSAVTLPGDFDLEDRQYLPCRPKTQEFVMVKGGLPNELLNARATSGFNSHLLATSVYANMLKVLQVIKTCIISTLVPGKLGEKLYVIRTFELMEIEGLELAIGSALDILYTMLSKFSKEISSIPSVFHQAVLSRTTTPVPVFAAVTSLISYFRNPAVQVGATKIADLRHSVESSLQSGEHEDLFVASVNLLTSAAHYQPAFLIAFFSTTESEDVPQSNDSGMNRSANEASSGLLGSKKSGVINAILLYIERSDDLIKSNPRVLLNVLHFLKALWQGAGQYTNILESLKSSRKFWKHLSNSFSLITRLQSPVLEGITEVESHNLAYKYQWANTNLQPAVSYGTHKNV